MADTLAVGRIAWWRFNGNLLDSSGNGRTLSDGWGHNFATDKDGNPNSCMGANSYLGLNEKLILNVNNEPFSYYIWFEKNINMDTQVLVGNGTYTQGGCYAYQQDGELGITADWTQYNISGIVSIPDGWNLLSVKYNGSTLKIKFNNVLLFNKLVNIATPTESYEKFAVGCYTDRDSYPWKSRFDEAGVYNRELTDAEETLIFNRGVNCQPPTIATPTSNLNTGSYEGTQLLELSCETVGATIRYTLTGIEPSESSMEYTDSIALTTGVYQLRAKAFKNGIGSETLIANITITEVTQMAEIEERLLMLGPADLAIRAFTDPTPVLTTGAIVVGKKYLTVTIGTGITVNTSDTPDVGEVFTATVTTVTWNGGSLSLVNEVPFEAVAALQDKTLILTDEVEYADATIEEKPGTIMGRMYTKHQTKGTITLISFSDATLKLLTGAKATTAGGVIKTGMAGKQVPYYEIRVRPRAFPGGSQDVYFFKCMITAKENRNFSAKEDSKRTLEVEFIAIPLLTGVHKDKIEISGDINSLEVIV